MATYRGDASQPWNRTSPWFASDRTSLSCSPAEIIGGSPTIAISSLNLRNPLLVRYLTPHGSSRLSANPEPSENASRNNGRFVLPEASVRLDFDASDDELSLYFHDTLVAVLTVTVRRILLVCCWHVSAELRQYLFAKGALTLVQQAILTRLIDRFHLTRPFSRHLDIADRCLRRKSIRSRSTTNENYCRIRVNVGVQALGTLSRCARSSRGTPTVEASSARVVPASAPPAPTALL